VKGSRARPAGEAGESIAESEKTSRKSPRRHRSASHWKASRKHVDRGGSNDHDVLLVPSQAPEVFEDYIAGAQEGQSVCGGIYYEFDLTMRAIFATPATPVTGQSQPLGFSSTNLQEATVDEADRVKFDGSHLFIADSLTSYHSDFFFGGWAIAPPIGRPIAQPILVINPPPTTILLPAPVTTTTLPAPAAPVAPINTIARVEDVAPDPSLPPVHSVRVMAVNPDEPGSSEVARIELPNASGGIHGLYHLSRGDANQGDTPQAAFLAVLGTRNVYASAPSWNQQLHTTLDVYDVADAAEPMAVANLELDGRLVTSRRLGDRLILVTRLEAPRSRPYPCSPLPPGILEDDTPTQGEEDEENAPVQILPQLRVDTGELEPLVGIDDCFVPASALASGTPTSVITTVTSIDLRDPSDRTSMCLAGAAGTVYASSEALYISQPETVSPEPLSDSELIRASLYKSGQRIFKIALDEAGPIYRGSVFVEGNSSSRFAMGEHEDVLGIMTSVGWSEHRLTLLREAQRPESDTDDPSAEPFLEIVSQLPNDQAPAPIGKPGESLHAVRFMGPRVYAVTFKKIDPLYIIDVSTPEQPYIAGEVEIPGFSDYLHPIGENLLLGVGKDAFDMESFAWYQGIKLELFDVSDPTTLSSIDSVLVGMRGSQSAALADSHAITHLPLGEDRHRFSVPVEVHEGPEGPPQTYHPWVETGLFLFEVEENSNPLESTIENVGAIVRATPTADNHLYASPDAQTTDDRSVLSEDHVHYIHGEEVWSASWFAPEEAVGPQ
jgi:hypothetical protein